MHYISRKTTALLGHWKFGLRIFYVIFWIWSVEEHQTQLRPKGLCIHL